MINIPVSKTRFKAILFWAISIMWFVIFLPIGLGDALIIGTVLNVIIHLIFVMIIKMDYNEDILEEIYFFFYYFKFTDND